MRSPLEKKKELLSSIIDENYQKIFRLCMRYFGNREEAEDATQDVFEKVWMNIEKFRGEASVSTWVFRIATNVCLSTLRRKKIEPVRMDVLKAENSDEDYHEEKRVMEREEARIKFLNEFLQELNPADRSIVSLYLENVDSKTIAEIMGMTDTNIRTRIHRIKNLIKTEWERKYGA